MGTSQCTTVKVCAQGNYVKALDGSTLQLLLQSALSTVSMCTSRPQHKQCVVAVAHTLLACHKAEHRTPCHGFVIVLH